MATRSIDDHDYTRSSRRHSSHDSAKLKRWLWYAALGLLAFVVFTSTWNYVVVPYNNYYERRVARLHAAKKALTDPEGICAKADKAGLREQLGEFNNCLIANVTASKDPRQEAFNDIIQYLQVCAGGECLKITMTVFSYMNWIVWGTALLSLLLCGGLATTLFVMFYRSFQQGYALPLHGCPVQHAASMQQYAHKQPYETAAAARGHDHQYGYPPSIDDAHQQKVNIGNILNNLVGSTGHVKQH